MRNLSEQRVYDLNTQTNRIEHANYNMASPHRAEHSTGIHPEDRPYVTTGDQGRKRQPMPRRLGYSSYDDGEGNDDAIYDTRTTTSARRYNTTTTPTTQQPKTVVRYHVRRQQVPARRSRVSQEQGRPSPAPLQDRYTEPQRTQTQRAKTVSLSQWHPAVYIILTIVVGLLVFGGVAFGLNWWQRFQDDLHYGRPRTFQCDARVGHHDARTPSHFIVVNLDKQIKIIEFPGGDATHALVYQGPTLVGDGQDLTPVTLEFRDVNGDGKPDMIVHIQDSRTVFVNTTLNGVPQFRLATASDSIVL